MINILLLIQLFLYFDTSKKLSKLLNIHMYAVLKLLATEKEIEGKRHIQVCNNSKLKELILLYRQVEQWEREHKRKL